MKRFMKFFPLSGNCDMVPSLILSNVLILMYTAEFPVPLLPHMQSDHSDPLSSSGEVEITQARGNDLWKHVK